MSELNFLPIAPQAKIPLEKQVPPELAKTAKLKETAQDFESFFVYQVLELMQPDSLGEDNLFGGGFAEQMYRHKLNEQVADKITERGGFGIADSIYPQLLKYQEQR